MTSSKRDLLAAERAKLEELERQDLPWSEMDKIWEIQLEIEKLEAEVVQEQQKAFKSLGHTRAEEFLEEINERASAWTTFVGLRRQMRGLKENPEKNSAAISDLSLQIIGLEREYGLIREASPEMLRELDEV